MRGNNIIHVENINARCCQFINLIQRSSILPDRGRINVSNDPRNLFVLDKVCGALAARINNGALIMTAKARFEEIGDT